MKLESVTFLKIELLFGNPDDSRIDLDDVQMNLQEYRKIPACSFKATTHQWVTNKQIAYLGKVFNKMHGQGSSS